MRPKRASPRADASSTAANTLSTRCCVRATSTTEPNPWPPMNSPTMAPITASPDATRSPVRIWGNAAGNRSLKSVTAVDAPYSLNKSRSAGSVERIPDRVLAITGKMDTTNAEATTVRIP